MTQVAPLLARPGTAARGLKPRAHFRLKAGLWPGGFTPESRVYAEVGGVLQPPHPPAEARAGCGCVKWIPPIADLDYDLDYEASSPEKGMALCRPCKRLRDCPQPL